MIEHRLVIGPGGCGRSHALRRWLEQESIADGTRVSGSPLRPVDESNMKDLLLNEPALLVVDDLQWCETGALELLVARADQQPIWASRRPWPRTRLVRQLDDLLTQHRAAERVGLLDLESFSPVVAEVLGRPAPTELIDALHAATGGSPALVSDCLAAGWDDTTQRVPEELIDAILRRVERGGPGVLELVRVLAVDATLDDDVAAAALHPDIDADDAQRAVRAAGVLDSHGVLVPVVAKCVHADLTATERREIHDRLANVLGASRPDQADDHRLAGSSDSADAGVALLGSAARLRAADPTRSLELLHQADRADIDNNAVAVVRAEALFHLGSSEAITHLAGVPLDARVALIQYGLDLRDLRWVSATDRPLEGDAAAALIALAGLFGGERPDETLRDASPQDPVIELVHRIVASLDDFAAGEHAAGLGGLALAADDYDRLNPDLPLGITPHALAALAAMGGGDVLAADDLLSLAIEANSGGAGERRTHQLLLAYVRLLSGRYHDALSLVRAGEDDDWPQRDRFLLAALDAALARRSGDTTRLREAWRRADPVLVRQAPTWLLLDPLTELLAAGARLGHDARVAPVLAATLEQCQRLAGAGPAEVSGAWLQLQLALASSEVTASTEWSKLVGPAEALSVLSSDDRRSQARIAVGRVWLELAHRRVDETAAAEAAASLAEVGEPWEASRLVGQAALDCEDPQAARRLLEQARTFAADPNEAEGEDGLSSLGLSEREADVARLVVEGRTHKEVGSQLYISPKTVEHHVAKIRQKLGVGSRAEMMSAIRSATD